MPRRSLIQVINDAILARKRLGSAGGDIGFLEELLFSQGDIVEVKETGKLVIDLPNGRTVTADPTTDESFLRGQQVWVSKTEEDTWIVHGGSR